MHKMQIVEDKFKVVNESQLDYSLNLINKDDPILCNHCLRTASNGIRCMGICVADNDY